MGENITRFRILDFGFNFMELAFYKMLIINKLLKVERQKSEIRNPKLNHVFFKKSMGLDSKRAIY
jgi:hypothetical protein